MAEILVQPSQLAELSNQLRQHLQNLEEALSVVDTEIQSLGIGRFDNERANALRTQHDNTVKRIRETKLLVESFAVELDAVASRFRAADNG